MRVRAVCDHIFDGDIAQFASQFNIRPRRVKEIFSGRVTVTVKVVAEILTKSSVRTEWLLWGDGAMLDYGGPTDEKPGTLILPDKLHSSFPLFDPLHSLPPLKEFEMGQFIPLERRQPKRKGQFAIPTDNYAGVATSIHECCTHKQPVAIFMGPDAISAGAGLLVASMLEKKYVTAVATTGHGLVADLEMAGQPVDLNRVARLAAQHGIGYGEAIGRWGFAPRDGDRDRSLFYTAHLLGMPATAHVEIGEIPNHLCPTVRGAEVGAAIGAATYADFLLFTATIAEMQSSGGGVFIITGDVHQRAASLFMQAANVTNNGHPANVTLVSIDSNSKQHTDLECENLRLQGHKTHILPGLYRGTMYKLIEACDAIFSGKTFHDIKQH